MSTLTLHVDNTYSRCEDISTELPQHGTYTACCFRLILVGYTTTNHPRCYVVTASAPRRKPAEVLPQHKRRAVTLFITLIVAILACEFANLLGSCCLADVFAEACQTGSPYPSTSRKSRGGTPNYVRTVVFEPKVSDDEQMSKSGCLSVAAINCCCCCGAKIQRGRN